MDRPAATNMKTQKYLKRALLSLLALLLITAGFLWNRYWNKNSLIAAFETPERQQVYLLGTMHKNHFEPWRNYSMEDVLSVVERVQPDAVFIEAREESYRKDHTVDGPIDMCILYAYCMEHGISAEMIDWWVVDNDFQENSTNARRDDHIFTNINTKLHQAASVWNNVLVVCGTGHFYEQSRRFTDAGYQKIPLGNAALYFDDGGKPFSYPSGAAAVWKQRAYYYAYTLPALVEQDAALNETVKQGFASEDHDAYYRQQLQYCTLFEQNRLYQ